MHIQLWPQGTTVALRLVGVINRDLHRELGLGLGLGTAVSIVNS